MEEKTMTQKMTRILIAIALMVTCSGLAVAQEKTTNQLHIGLIYPLSTNGKAAPSDTNDLSIHLISGISKQENACLIAGISGIVTANVYGTMVSGVSNHVGADASGVLVAGLLNHVKGKARGLQIAGVINKSSDAHTQVAGLINIAKRVEGVQVAGFINIAQQSDYPVGLINIIRDGELALGLSVDEAGGLALALRSGGRVLYGIIGLGYQTRHQEARYLLEGGLGAHLVTTKAFRLSAELASAAMTSFEDGVYGKQSLRILGGWRITPSIELIGGPTFNHLLFDADQTDIRDGRYLWQSQSPDVFNGLYFGGMLGLQFLL